MAQPTVVSQLVAGRGNGANVLNPGNASVNGSTNLDLGTSGTVTVLALVSTHGSNSESIDSVTVGTGGGQVTLTASETLRTLGGFGTGTLRAFALDGITLTGSQTYEVTTSGAGFAIDVHFVVLDSGSAISYSAQADVLVSGGATHTKTISSNADSLIVEAFLATYTTTVWTAGSGDTATKTNGASFARVSVYGSGADGDVEVSPDATEILIGGAWSVEGTGGGGSSIAPIAAQHLYKMMG